MKTVDLKAVTTWDEFWKIGRYTRCNWRKKGAGFTGEVSPSVQLQEETKLILKDGTEKVVPVRTQLGRTRDEIFFVVVPDSHWQEEWELVVDQFPDEPGMPKFDL